MSRDKLVRKGSAAAHCVTTAFCRLPDCLSKAMNDELLKTCEELRKAGADGAVLASIENVTYVTNVEQPVHVGAMAATTVAPWLAIVSAKDERGIVLAPAGKVRRAGSKRARIRRHRFSDLRQLPGNRSACALCRRARTGTEGARPRFERSDPGDRKRMGAAAGGIVLPEETDRSLRCASASALAQNRTRDRAAAHGRRIWLMSRTPRSTGSATNRGRTRSPCGARSRIRSSWRRARTFRSPESW